jgi:hypothetical protein
MSIQECGDSLQRAPKPVSFWTEAKVDRLKQLVADGVCGQEIRAALGCTTMNMIYTKLRRLGVSMPAKVRRQPAPPRNGAGLDMMVCGERASGSYCERHHRIAYRGRRTA